MLALGFINKPEGFFYSTREGGSMAWNDKDGEIEHALERGFTVNVDGHSVPGVYWQPKQGNADFLVLLGHGGGTHKKVDYLLAMVELLAQRGIAAMSIDGPGHGERAQGDGSQSVNEFASLWHGAGGTETVIKDWMACLDFVEAKMGARATAWWGLSMGTMMGLPVTATDKRIRLALFGLMGDWGPNQQDLVRLAPKVTCPVRFLVQWDDEIVPRDACFSLFNLLGSKAKTLHANPGPHAAVPRFEMVASIAYLDEKLRKYAATQA